MTDIQEAQVMIWARPGEPLTQSAWEEAGFATLRAYVKSLLAEGTKNAVYSQPDRRAKIKRMNVCSFGTFNPKTGERVVLLSCKALKDLPTESIPGVLEFNPE